MTKRFTITVSNKTYEDYIQSFKGNRSEYIEDNFITGLETKSNDKENYKKEVIDLRSQLREAESIISKQLRTIETYKAKFNSKDKRNEIKLQEIEKENKIKKKIAFLRAVKNAGL